MRTYHVFNKGFFMTFTVTTSKIFPAINTYGFWTGTGISFGLLAGSAILGSIIYRCVIFALKGRMDKSQAARIGKVAHDVVFSTLLITTFVLFQHNLTTILLATLLAILCYKSSEHSLLLR